MADNLKKELDVLIVAAHDFVIKYNGPWSKANEYLPSCVQAFYLLMAYAKNRLDRLPPEVWRKFAPELLQALNYDTFDLVPLTLKYFAARQPNIFFDGLAKIFEKQLAKGETIELYKFREIIDAEAFTRLLGAVDKRDLTSEQRNSLYEEFWRVNPSLTADHINASCLSGVSIRECETLVSVYVLVSAPEKRFPELLTALHDNPNWGRVWAEQILGREDYRHCSVAGALRRLSVGALKDLYQWLLENFPPEKAPHRTGCYIPDRMDNVYQFISRVFNELVSRVDIELPRALNDLAKKFPRLTCLREWMLRARRILLEKDCPIYDIDTIKQILEKKKNSVFVNSPSDLLAVVCDALQRYQTYLTGKESPQVACLWNENKSVVSHKDEHVFSDHIKAYLDLVLTKIVVNREVQLSKTHGSTDGAKTDIWITAIPKVGDKRMRLCIEVKGSWNCECKTAFKGQLCERYMGDGGADAGIFLVGWFYSECAKANRNQWKDMCSAEYFLKGQEDDLLKQGYIVKSIVVDCTY